MRLPKNITIEDFINNPYYLGDIVKDIYPYWKEHLIRINNDDYRTAVFHGYDCNGKTSIQLIQLLYDYYKLQLLDNPKEDLNVIGNIDLVIVHNSQGIAEHLKRFVLKILEESDFIKDLKQAGKFKNNIKIHSYHFDRLERLYGLNVTTILIDDLHDINHDILDAWLNYYSHMIMKPECKNAGHILINSSLDLQNIQLVPCDLDSKVYRLKTLLLDVRKYGELTKLRSYCQDFIKNTSSLTKEDIIKFTENSEVK